MKGWKRWSTCGEMEEKAKLRGPFTVEKLNLKCKAVRKRQMWGGHGVALADTKDIVWVHGPPASEVNVYVCGLSYHQRPHWCLCSGILLKVMLMSVEHASEWVHTVMRGLGCHLRSWGHLGPMLLLEIISAAVTYGIQCLFDVPGPY